MNSSFLLFLAVFTIGIDLAVSKPSRKYSMQDLIGGDIRYDPKQRNFWKGSKKWINGEVPFVIDPELSASHVKAIMEAIQAYKDKTCIRLIPKTGGHKDYIRFMNGGDGQCNSNVGRQIGGQNLSLGAGCDATGIAIHEIMHALGFNHEHVRPDRDNYVKVHFDLLEEKAEWIYRKLSPFSVELQNLRYDYLSIMHYARNFFGKGNVDTIETLDKTYQYIIGTKLVFSVCDLEKINRLYECKNYILPDNPCKDTTPPPSAESFQTIESLMHGLVLNVPGGSTNAGTPIILWGKPQDAFSSNDRFFFKKANDDYFYIESALSPDLVLDIEGGSTKPGAQVVLMPQKNPPTNSQLWRWKGQAIQSALGDLVLSVKDSSKDGGTSCVTESYSGNSNQLWLHSKEETSTTVTVASSTAVTVASSTTPPSVQDFQMIESLMHGKVLNVEGGYPNSGARIILYQKQDEKSVNDRFKFKQSSNGYFYIVSALDPKMVFDIEGGINAKAAAQVILMPIKNSDDPAVTSQLWRWNGQTIQSALGDLVLNVHGSSTESGTACIAYPRSGVYSNELWRLSKE